MINLIKADLYKETRKKSLIYLILVVSIFTVVYLYISSKNLNSSDSFSPKLGEKEYFSINSKGDYQEYLEKYNDYEKSSLVSSEINSETVYSKTREIVINSMPLYYLVGIVPEINIFGAYAFLIGFAVSGTLLATVGIKKIID